MKIIQGELYNMFASFKMDDLITLGSNLEKYYAIGMEEKRISQRMVEKQLDKYLSSTGELQAVEIENDWFPTVNADVFLSHSHKDEKQIIALAGELRSEYGLRSFIDSCVWGYSEDLLRIINNNYNLKENEDGTNIYDYEGSNQASTHVNMILNSALMKMIDKTECIIFIDTPNSLKVSNIKEGVTASPWIYSELLATRLLERNILIRKSKNSFMDQMFVEHSGLKVDYKVDISHLTSISRFDFVIASKPGRKKGKELLDQLYYNKFWKGKNNESE